MAHCPLKYLLFGLLIGSGNLFADCGTQAVRLSAIQGNGDVSPLTGRTVTVEGVITLDARQPGGWRGFYLQQPAGTTDQNTRTSDALFIYTDRKGGTEGSRVRVTGQVKEYHGLTELTRVSDLTLCGRAPLPDPIPVQLPWPDNKPPEHLENMRVAFSKPLTLIGHYTFARYGELMLAEQPQAIPTERMAPGPDARALASSQSLNRVYLDDGSSAQNPRPLPWPARLLAEGVPVRAGDRLADLTGVLDYRFGHWRLQPVQEPQLIRPLTRPEPPARPDDRTLRIVTLNLGNFFNGDGEGGSFADGRGARNASQWKAQKSRLAAALTTLNPDILAAVEVENDDYGATSAIAELAAVLGPRWQYVSTPGTTGNDAIRTDLLYRADRVQPAGQPQRLNAGVFGHRGRPPVSQLFRPVDSESKAVFRVVVPHFKSKSCGGASGEDRDQSDGQGCYAHRRSEESEALADWLKTLPKPEHFAGTLINGDLNSYAREWPLTHLERAGFTNLVRARQACGSDQCPATTFRYRGRHGSLDYTLGSSALLNRVADAGVWAINAEEFPATGYQGQIPAASDSLWRASDHNPVYTDLSL